MENMMNKKVIVRGDRSGVFFGTLAGKEGSEVKLEKCRRLWYWDGAASLSQMANDGVKNPKACRFTQVVENMQIAEVIEVLPCTDAAIKCIEEVNVWQR